MKITTKTHRKMIAIMRKVYPDYAGRKFYLHYVKSIDTNFNRNWSEGARTYYTFIRLDTGKTMQMPDLAPLERIKNVETEIPQGCACVTHSYFMGIDCGLTCYLPTHCELPLEI